VSAAVEARSLGKKYKRYGRTASRLIEWATLGRAVLHEPRWVLRGVDLSVAPGECLGVVGQNGSGKSTLLKILAGVSVPSEGAFEVRGRCAALLELGLGFHPDFTGRQNAALSLRLQGCDAREAASLLPGVEDFAEVGDYFDQPVRTYSSGMHVRLAFAAATAFRPEIFLVDEALAVGDAYFQSKCFARIRAYREAGTALLFVSHDPVAVRSLCDRALLLDRGRPVLSGSPDEVLDHYNAMIAVREADAAIRRAETERGVATVRSGSGTASLETVELSDGEGVPRRAFLDGETARVTVRFRTREPMAFPTVGFLIRDVMGNDVFGTNTFHLGVAGPSLPAGGEGACDFRVELALGAGRYTLSAALHTGPDHVACNYDWWDKLIAFEVLPGRRPFFAGVASLRAQARVTEPREGE